MPTTTHKYFAFAHLPPKLQAVSKPVGELATALEALLPDGPEKSAGMRKLLEAKDCFVRCALDMPEPAASTVPPHQQRVLDEKRDLDGRLSKLDAFILDNPLYRQLPGEEQDRLSRQSEAMAAYSGILGERIDAFSAQAAVTDAATITLPVVDPGPDSLEREIQAKARKAPPAAGATA